MIDLETLGTDQNAVVISIGVVLMDMNEKRVLRENSFYHTLHWGDQVKRGRAIDAGTVKWWLEQSKDAQAGVLVKPMMDNQGVLAELGQFLPKGAAVWGNGADFDCTIMQSLYRTYEMYCPWKYNMHRCFRTMRALSTVPAAERTGVHHNALDDAITQAEHLMQILRVGFP